MTDFMEYCLKQYYRSTGWNEEKQYSYLCSWSQSILDFQTSRSLSLVISQLPRSIYNKPDAISAVNGNIGYIYTTQALDLGGDASIDVQNQLDRFKVVTKQPAFDKKDPVYLIYGQMYFPGAKLEAMYTRRLSEFMQCSVTAINHSKTQVSPKIAIKLQQDKGKWCTEYFYTTHDGVVGQSTMYNLKQWSAGTEVYYGLLDKRRGLSAGIRYRMLAPVILTCSYKPLVGNVSTSCTATVSNQLVLSSRYECNVNSPDNDLAVGLEYKTRRSNDDLILTADKTENLVKLRWSYAKGLGLLWQGRVRNTLFSLGFTADLSSTSPIRTFGFEIQYFSS